MAPRMRRGSAGGARGPVGSERSDARKRFCCDAALDGEDAVQPGGHQKALHLRGHTAQYESATAAAARRCAPMMTPRPVASQESSPVRSSTRSPAPSSTAVCRTVRASAALRTSRRPSTTSSAWSPLMYIRSPRMLMCSASVFSVFVQCLCATTDSRAAEEVAVRERTDTEFTRWSEGSAVDVARCPPDAVSACRSPARSCARCHPRPPSGASVRAPRTSRPATRCRCCQRRAAGCRCP